MLPKITQWFKFKLEKQNPFKVRNWNWKQAVQLERWANGLERLATIAIKLGTLFLIVAAIVFVYRIFQAQGFVIDTFSVPAQLEEAGYNGAVVARKVQDEILHLKELGTTLKEDSLQLAGNQQPELNLAVMGIGVSLNSITYHLREMLGRPNDLIHGEVTRLTDDYTLTLRMTGFPAQNCTVRVWKGGEKAALDSLIRLAAEAVITNTDPYRLALVKYRQGSLEEAQGLVRHMLRHRPQEAHWAYLAWGIILEEKGRYDAALDKFRKAAKTKPDFMLAYARQSYTLGKMERYEESIDALRRALAIEPDNPGRLRNLAWMLHRQEQYAASDSIFERITQIEPQNPDSWTAWADSKLSRGKPQEALVLIDRADKMIGENAYGYFVRAMGALAKGDTSRALAHAQTAFDMDPSIPFIASGLIGANFTMKNYEAATSVFERMDKSATKDEKLKSAYNLAAMAYNMQGQHERAKAVVLEVIGLDSNLAAPYSTLAETYAFNGQVDSFYHYLHVAFEKGMPAEIIDEQLPPYGRFADSPRYQALLEKYRLKD